MNESTYIYVSRRNIRNNLRAAAPEPVLFLRKGSLEQPATVFQRGYSAMLEGPGRVFYRGWENAPPVLIESESPVLLDVDFDPPGEAGTGLVKRVYIHQQHLLKNKKGARLPPISVRTSRGVTACFEARVLGPSVIVYSNCKPQPCGARVWLETRFPIKADGISVPERAKT